MLYQLSYTRVFGGAAISGAAGQFASIPHLNPDVSPPLASSLPRRPAALLPRIHGGGRIRTYVGHSPADLQSATISHSVTPPILHPPLI